MDQTQEHRQRLIQVRDILRNTFGTPTWHLELPAVDELVCTILSQNTNDINRDKAFHALKARYPSWEAVRDADPGELEYVIRIAGLANQKGPNIQAALRDITAERGEIDLDWLRGTDAETARKWLVGLRGVGPKTAAIVMVFALGMPAFPVDTHVYRVTGRIGLRPAELDITKTHAYMEQIADPADYGTLHLNLIDLGREICQARKPKCPICPIRHLCQYENKTV
ncbi:MAG: endonuclease III [Anaerolineaceae bacterium]|nr:endonuclease III [Anaerolineaceae bacterium]